MDAFDAGGWVAVQHAEEGDVNRRLKGFSPITRHIILERAEGMCEVCSVITICGEAHHRRPRGAGGSRRPETNLPSNALWLCSGLDGGDACHDYIESHRTESLTVGWLVPQHRQPCEIPVLRRGVWVLLGNDGDIQEIPEPAGGRVA